MTPNRAFSAILPSLQTAVDSTSLGEFKICPRRYQLSIAGGPSAGLPYGQGWSPRLESIHLTFGLLTHSAFEQYHQQRAKSVAHEEALQSAVNWTLRATWRNGAPWQSDDPNKNRYTLIRTIVWYLDQFGPDDPLQTLTLASGQPAVELSFRFDSQYRSAAGEIFILCGHIDRIAYFQSQPWIVDVKTTKQTLGQSFFAKFTPHNQFSLYTLAGQIFYSVPVKGVIVDGLQIAVGFTKFDRQLVGRSDAQIAEWHRDLGYWLRQMEACAEAEYWPMDDKQCDNYGGCPFQKVCSQPSESSRLALLRTAYTPRTWDPTQARGDI